MVLLDYRCYVPGGKIGNDYPPELTKVMAICMSRHCHSIMRDRYYREASDGIDFVSPLQGTAVVVTSPSRAQSQCLKKLSSMTPMEIKDEYNFPQLREAEILSLRAKGEVKESLCTYSMAFVLNPVVMALT